jgi:predicted RNA binding protein YcfA (HicA-like mRNA interferase family)
MPPLPVCSRRETVRALERDGWYVERQRGSHVSLAKAGQPNTVSVPDHKELRPGTLRSLLRDAGLTVADFIRLLGRD